MVNVQDMLQYLEISQHKLGKVRRLGKRKTEQDDHYRPLLVELESEEKKWIVLSQGKFLK